MQSEANNEMDLVELFSLVFSYKKILFIVTVIVMASVFGISYFLPKSYTAQASFFVNQSGGAMSGSLGVYSSLLGGDSELENRLEEVINSWSMQAVLLKKARPFFGKQDSLDEIKKQINFKGNFKLKKTPKSLFVLKFESKNPQLSFEVLQECLSQIHVFNEKLELSEKSDVISILDFPEVPKKPTGPKIVVNTIVSGIAAFFLGVVAVLIFHAFRRNPAKI